MAPDLLDEAVGDERDAGADQGGAGQVERAGVVVAGLGHVADGDPAADRRHRHVEEEDQPPGAGVDQPPADERPDGAGHRRPGPTRRRSPGPGRRGRTPAEMIDRLAGTSSAPATPWRARAATRNPTSGASPHSTEAVDEADQAGDEHPPPPVAVAGAAAQQEEGRQRDEVGVEHPLEARTDALEVVADGRQGDVDDRAVEEHHPRAEHGGDDHPPALGGAEPDGASSAIGPSSQVPTSQMTQ